MQNSDYTMIPLKWVGPLKIAYQGTTETLSVPLATYESPLWPSTGRGARVSMKSDGIKVSIVNSGMTRSILLEAASAEEAVAAAQQIEIRKRELSDVVASTTSHGTYRDLQIQPLGNLLFIRLEINPADASGHNMVTNAAEAVLNWLSDQFPSLQYRSLSGNFCTDKKVSAVNGILGRGRYTIAELIIPNDLCTKMLKTTPDAIAKLNQQKNWMGSTLAGSLRSANAHLANMLLAFYLATGQDGANIIEGSQAFTMADVTPTGDLRFSVTLPNLIVGTIGNGKGLPGVTEALGKLGCLENRKSGENANRLAAIAAATALCGELSLLAALTNPGELMRAHRALERGKSA